MRGERKSQPTPADSKRPHPVPLMLNDWAQTERGLKSSLCIRLEEDWYIVGREESALAVLTTSKYSSTLRKKNEG